MARNPNAGHAGAVGKPHRCRICEHRPNRVVSHTVKTRGGTHPAEPRQHKKPCDCSCHTPDGA